MENSLKYTITTNSIPAGIDENTPAPAAGNRERGYALKQKKNKLNNDETSQLYFVTIIHKTAKSFFYLKCKQNKNKPNNNEKA